MVRQWQIPEGQRHAAATLRNLATPEHIATLVTSGVVEVLVSVVTNAKTLQPVLHEVQKLKITDSSFLKSSLSNIYLSNDKLCDSYGYFSLLKPRSRRYNPLQVTAVLAVLSRDAEAQSRFLLQLPAVSNMLQLFAHFIRARSDLKLVFYSLGVIGGISANCEYLVMFNYRDYVILLNYCSRTF